jgi:hypothetical protein
LLKTLSPLTLIPPVTIKAPVADPVAFVEDETDRLELVIIRKC